MKPAPFNQKELDKEMAYDGCKRFGTPDPSVDHSNHYKKIKVLMELGKEKE